MQCQRQSLETPDPFSGRNVAWTVELDDGRQIPWRGLQTGPLTLDEERIDAICQDLLGHGLDTLEEHADRVLRPATGTAAELPAFLLHSTTPELKTFDGDLDTLARGLPSRDFTTYKEARSVYLARPGDIAVGRTASWKAAVDALGTESIELEDVDHYYLSHALLHLAHRGRDDPGSAVGRMVGLTRAAPRVARLYAIEREMQIFLLWLAHAAGLETLAIDANRPALSAAWNRKAVLHPTVAEARQLDLAPAGHGPGEDTMQRPRPMQCLEVESRHCATATELGIEIPRVPGYTLERTGASAEDFAEQNVAAAHLLRERYGLRKGCLKASESGDGARITPGLDLEDEATLRELGRAAHVHGDDYVLEAHVDYGRATIAGETLSTALSAHVRGGEVAEGSTVQFMEGTSWKGNVLLDEDCLELFGISADAYARLWRFIEDFRDGFARRAPGLVLAGVDFAIGTVGGAFGDTPLLGVQDLNVSFTGAECLRAFLEKAERVLAADDRGATSRLYGATRIFYPRPDADHAAFLRVTESFRDGPIYADTVASIPGRWGMVGVTGTDPRDAIENLGRLRGALAANGLIDT